MQFNSRLKIYIIVGEESGENLAYNLLTILRNKRRVALYGIGGERLKKLGLNPIFSYTRLSVMGLIEIIPKLPVLLYLINKTVRNIISVNPDLIITFDAPDFSFRVLNKIKRVNSDFKTLHVVAPTVWAWKAYRAKKISNYVDSLFVLFDFEKKYFTRHGITTTTIRHPFLEKINNEIRKAPNLLKLDKKIISIYPGSRKGEIKRHLNLILKYISLGNYSKNYAFIIIAVDNYFDIISEITYKYVQQLDIKVYKSSKYKHYAFKFSDYAIAVSGTVSLELALCKIPLIVVYKLNKITYLILRNLVKVKYVSLANIILNKKIIPELIQSELSYKNFNYELSNLINNNKFKKAQLKMFEKLRRIMSKKNKTTNAIALKKVLKLI